MIKKEVLISNTVNFINKNFRNIAIFTYIVFNIFTSIYYQPRLAFLLLPLLVIEMKRSYEKSEEFQMGFTKHFIDNFLVKRSNFLVRSCLAISILVFVGRNLAAHYILKGNDNMSIYIFRFLTSLGLNILSFVQGNIISTFLPNPNCTNKKLFYKTVFVVCLLISMFPLALNPTMRPLSILYVSNFFMTICGYIDGCTSLVDPDTFEKNWGFSFMRICIILYNLSISIICTKYPWLHSSQSVSIVV